MKTSCMQKACSAWILPVAGGLVAGAAVLVPATGFSQANDAGGATLRFDVSSELRQNDNLGLDVESEGSSTIWDTGLGFALRSRTSASALSFTGHGVLREADLPSGHDSGFEDPRLGLSYSRQSSGSRFAVDANWRKTDLRYSDPLADEILVEDVATGEQKLQPRTGSRQILGFGTELETGIGGPLGFTLGLNHREVSYDNTNDPDDYYDSTRDSVRAGLRVALTPTTSASLNSSFSHYEAENDTETERDTSRLTFGLSHDLASGVRIYGELGRSQIDETENDGFGGHTTDNTSGAVGNLGLRRELGDGSIGVDYARSLSTTGDRETLRFSRELELPNATLGGNVGLTQGDAGHTAVVANVSWEKQMARGRWSMGLSRSARTNDDDQDLLVTQASFNWTHDLNAENDVSLGLNLASIEGDGDDSSDDAERARLRLVWGHELIRDVRMSVGYEYRWLDEKDEDGTADSNMVFLSIGKSFDFRP